MRIWVVLSNRLHLHFKLANVINDAKTGRQGVGSLVCPDTNPADFEPVRLP